MYTLTCSTSHQIQQVSAQNSGESCALDTRQRSVLTVLSAVKIVDVIIINGYVRVGGSVHEGSSRNVGSSYTNHYALKFEKKMTILGRRHLKITPLLFC